MPGPKVYLKCSAKARQTQYGEMLNIGIKVDDLIAFAEEHENERGYLNITISQRREVGQYGDTHSVMLDTYRSQPQQRQSQEPEPDEFGRQPITDDDIPF